MGGGGRRRETQIGGRGFLRQFFFEAVFDFIVGSQKPTRNKAVLMQRPTTHSIEKAWALSEKSPISIGLFLKRDMTCDWA